MSQLMDWQYIKVKVDCCGATKLQSNWLYDIYSSGDWVKNSWVQK